jgi:hypothetical protein
MRTTFKWKFLREWKETLTGKTLLAIQEEKFSRWWWFCPLIDSEEEEEEDGVREYEMERHVVE